MNRAEKLALQQYHIPEGGDIFRNSVRDAERSAFQLGYYTERDLIIALIESRISEILGDAQPKPALRAELQELIKRIKEEEK